MSDAGFRLQVFVGNPELQTSHGQAKTVLRGDKKSATAELVQLEALVCPKLNLVDIGWCTKM